MKYNPDIHHRKSLRLKHYDYSQTGAYFVTICTHNRECVFGAVVDGKMILNEAGEMVENWCLKIPDRFSTVEIDAHTIMPNHFHGIITLVGADPRVCPDAKNNNIVEGAHMGAPLQKIVQCFKTMTTNEYMKNVKNKDWHPFDKKLWQRNYYEHIIRGETELNKIREYIINNPLHWQTDEENPDKQQVSGIDI